MCQDQEIKYMELKYKFSCFLVLFQVVALSVLKDSSLTAHGSILPTNNQRQTTVNNFNTGNRVVRPTGLEKSCNSLLDKQRTLLFPKRFTTSWWQFHSCICELNNTFANKCCFSRYTRSIWK